MLRLVNVEVAFHTIVLVLRGVSLEVPSTGIVCLLGANGAGKTTTLKAISGLLHYEDGKVSDGFVEFEGNRIDQLSTEVITRTGILQVMEGRRLFGHLTVEENLRTGAVIDPSNAKATLGLVYNYFPTLTELRRRAAGYLSGGEQQQLVIGRALMASPKLILMDEPSLGLAPLLVKRIFGIIKRIHDEEGIGILLVEQNANAALQIAGYGYVLENGRIVLDGTAEMLRDNDDVKEFYLGLSALGSRRSYKELKHYRRRKRWL